MYAIAADLPRLPPSDLAAPAMPAQRHKPPKSRRACRLRPDPPRWRRTRKHAAAATAPPSIVRASPRASTAAELFASANEARRRGDDARTESTFRELQNLYPSSPEAATSRVVLGLFLLEHAHDPKAAKTQFDAFLARSASGPLHEEALVGRARALEQLGRSERGARCLGGLARRVPRQLVGGTCAG